MPDPEPDFDSKQALEAKRLDLVEAKEDDLRGDY